MSEVYEVCQRLKAAGFPQNIGEYMALPNGDVWRMHSVKPPDTCAIPNASECMKFARERWPSRSTAVGWDTEISPPAWWAHIVSDNGDIRQLAENAPDPDQAARLALAAALEAEHV